MTMAIIPITMTTNAVIIGKIIDAFFFCVMAEYKILHKKMLPSTAAICAGLHKKSIIYIVCVLFPPNKHSHNCGY